MNFSLGRLFAVFYKEFIQMRRDRLTFAMMVGIPVIQLVLFGFAINTDPKALPTAVLVQDHSPLTRRILAAIENSGYFKFVQEVESEAEMERLLAEGDVQFVIEIPQDFTRDLVRGEKPVLLVSADATDPAATGNAITALQQINLHGLDGDLTGPLASLRSGTPAFELSVHRRYNPEGVTQYNIVPGLMGVILTMTMIIMTAMAITREVERGTMENLLATPVQPLEVMLGKILPYIVVGYVQVTVIMTAAHYIFHVPVAGSLTLLLACILVFIAANLTIGILFSTVAKSQMQAMQMGFFFFLPSILLSGFMFPFRGMPHWAQVIGEVLPLTHFLRIVRGILLKGNTAVEIWPHLWPMLLFIVVVMTLGLKRYRRTLD
ncbi:MAG: ABC transporter permease [Pedobacter sp.]|nr:ABC transporter permease [Pedobacter sp.]